MMTREYGHTHPTSCPHDPYLSSWAMGRSSEFFGVIGHCYLDVGCSSCPVLCICTDTYICTHIYTNIHTYLRTYIHSITYMRGFPATGKFHFFTSELPYLRVAHYCLHAKADKYIMFFHSKIGHSIITKQFQIVVTCSKRQVLLP